MKCDSQTTQLLKLTRDLLLAYTRFDKDLLTHVKQSQMSGAIDITIQAHHDDHPKIIGTRGQHILALKTIMNAIGAKMGRPIRITVLDPCAGEKLPLTPFQPDKNWKVEPVKKLMGRILEQIFTTQPEVAVSSSGVGTTFEIMPALAEWDKVANPDRTGPSELIQSLHYLFHAIGKGQGRLIYIDGVQPKDAPKMEKANAR